MIRLEKDWMTTGVLDIEYKQYELLAYLQKVENMFDNLKLYPFFSDVMVHYELLIDYKQKKMGLNDSFPKKLVDISLSESKLKYDDLIIDSDYMKQLDLLVDFTLPELRKKISLGKLIYDEVEKCVDILELGLTHYTNEKGFFIISDETIDVYEYELSPLYNGENRRALKTKLIRCYPIGYHMSYETIRIDLLNTTKILNPSTFIIDSPIKYPVEETLLPITKRLLLKKLL